MSKLQTVAVVIIAFTVTLAVFYYAGLFDEFLVPSQNMPEDTAPNSTPLTPARNLEGTWKTAFPVKFYIKTDFETFGEGLVIVLGGQLDGEVFRPEGLFPAAGK